MTDVTGNSTGERIVTNVSTTAAELPRAGSPAAAPVAPAKGPTGVEPGTPVVVVAEAFWNHPTIRMLRSILVGAWTALLLYVCGQIVTNKGVFLMDWTATIHAAINVGVLSLASALFAWLTTKNNNPVA